MWGGISRFPVAFVLTHKTANFHWELFSVSENFWYGKRSSEKTEVVAKFRHIFCVSIYRKIGWELFVVSRNFRQRKRFMDARRDITFCRRFLSSHFTANLFWELFGVSKTFWQRKVDMDETRGYHVFPWKYFESQFRRNSLRSLRGFRKFLVWEEIYEQDGGNANFRQTFFVSFYRESALGTLRCFTKVLVAVILHEWERGISRFSVANFLYQSFGNFFWNFSLFQKTSRSEIT